MAIDSRLSTGVCERPLQRNRRMQAAGQMGQTYNIGDWNEKLNIEIVLQLCEPQEELHLKTDD